MPIRLAQAHLVPQYDDVPMRFRTSPSKLISSAKKGEPVLTG